MFCVVAVWKYVKGPMGEKPEGVFKVCTNYYGTEVVLAMFVTRYLYKDIEL